MDQYVRRARVYPALLTFLPVGLLAVAIFPSPPQWWKGIAGVLVASGVLVFAAQFGRTYGRRKQDELYGQWGGKPTTLLLRFSGAANPLNVKRLHDQIEGVLNWHMPSASEEMRDSFKADAAYESAAEQLRELTRDPKRFSLVYEENCDYGFRRNLYGLKPVGITISVGSALGALMVIALSIANAISVSTVAVAVAALFHLVSIMAWIVVVTPDWVRDGAFAYAERLLASVAMLANVTPPPHG